jgi:hypothetical protein
MLDYIQLHGLGADSCYAHIQTLMDVDEYADYQIFQIYYANTDWPGNNITYWRPRAPEGRWRWVIFDTDFGLGLIEDFTHNTLAFAIEPNGPPWPNPPHATFLLRSLVENATFRRSFINRYCDHLSSTFLPARTVAMTQEIAAVIDGEIIRHLQHWGEPPSGWPHRVNRIVEFLNLRPNVARSHLRQEFGLGSELTLTLDVSPPAAGSIRLAAISVDSSWSGIYFQGVPIALTAVPAAGYAFAEWSDPNLPDSVAIEISPTGDYALTAIFTESIPSGVAVINEINYNSSTTFDPGDWVELHNPTEIALDLSDWVFKDEVATHGFVIPDGTTLVPGGYLVLCTDVAAFSALFPGVQPVLGDLGFGFDGGGELLRLFDPQTVLYDWVEYDDDPPWPPEPDGQGPTLELIDPFLDNALAESWVASSGHGTPGGLNGEPSGVTAPALITPRLALIGAYPNPFNPRTSVDFSVDRSRWVELAVYDVRGRRVRLLTAARFAAGLYGLGWSGRDDGGRVLPSGVYFLRMESEDYRAAAKILLVK